MAKRGSYLVGGVAGSELGDRDDGPGDRRDGRHVSCWVRGRLGLLASIKPEIIEQIDIENNNPLPLS